MLFKELANYFEKLEKTTSRNEMTEILAQLLKEIKDPKEAKYSAYLSLGILAPSYEQVELNIAEKTMLKILALSFGVFENKVLALFKQKGDLGIAAQELAKNQKGEDLSIAQIYQELYQISQYQGTGSLELKINHFAKLLKKLSPLEVRYIVRIPLGKLRLGFSDLTILDAISLAEKGDKSLRPLIERAYNLVADIGKIVEIFKKEGIKGLEKIKVVPGVPIRMSAAERVTTPQEIIEKMEGESAIEPKYDGFRLQVHLFKEGKDLKIKFFSRNLEDVSYMFPDLKEKLLKYKDHTLIFEGEAIGYNPNTGEFLPFQETIQRKRKYDIEEMAKDIPLKLFVFDILYLDGKELLNLPFIERRKLIEKIFPPPESEEDIVATNLIFTKDPKVIQELFEQYVSEGLEGILAKKPSALYEAGSRGFHWIKLKRSYHSKLADTIDALIMGYYKGKGKRAEFGIGAFLIGVLDEKSQTFKTIAKVGTGPTDEEWREIRKRCDQFKVKEKPKEYQVIKDLNPDVWVKPKIVVEITADEITKSPVHTAFQDKEGKGLGLRFPRFLRFREDKDPYQVTTEEEILKLYQLQRK